MSTSADEISPLERILSLYLDQDWECLYPSMHSALEDASNSETEDVRRAATREATHLLAPEQSDDHLGARLLALGLGYYPPADGLSFRDFLEVLIERLAPSGHYPCGE